MNANCYQILLLEALVPLWVEAAMVLPVDRLNKFIWSRCNAMCVSTISGWHFFFAVVIAVCADHYSLKNKREKSEKVKNGNGGKKERNQYA